MSALWIGRSRTATEWQADVSTPTRSDMLHDNDALVSAVHAMNRELAEWAIDLLGTRDIQNALTAIYALGFELVVAPGTALAEAPQVGSRDGSDG